MFLLFVYFEIIQTQNSRPKIYRKLHCKVTKLKSHFCLSWFNFTLNNLARSSAFRLGQICMFHLAVGDHRQRVHRNIDYKFASRIIYTACVRKIFN